MSQSTLKTPEEGKEESVPRPTKDLTPSEKFYRHFQHEISHVEALISNFGNNETGNKERGDAIDHCLASIARLNQEVNDASSYIPSYDQRTYGEAIKALGVKLHDARARFEPKKKFAFNKKAKAAAADPVENNGIVQSGASSGTTSPDLPLSASGTTDSKLNEVMSSTSPPTVPETVQPSLGTSTNLLLVDEANMHILLPVSPSYANGSGAINRLTHCIVDMFRSRTKSERHALQTLTLRNIKDTLLICSRVHGAVHLTNLTNSTIVVSSRQFRMHNSQNCDVYLLTSSRPIIEDCSGIRFAPLPETYRTVADDDVENQWQNVDDFKWLRAEPSPNWSILPAGQRVSETVWSEMVPGSPTVGLGEVLRAVGIRK